MRAIPSCFKGATSIQYIDGFRINACLDFFLGGKVLIHICRLLQEFSVNSCYLPNVGWKLPIYAIKNTQLRSPVLAYLSVQKCAMSSVGHVIFLCHVGTSALNLIFLLLLLSGKQVSLRFTESYFWKILYAFWCIYIFQKEVLISFFSFPLSSLMVPRKFAMQSVLKAIGRTSLTHPQDWL